jgi:hypothetical protein
MKPQLSKKIILVRIAHLEESIARCREYLQTGARADWRGFRPLFTAKMKDGKQLPPHPDWVRNWFLPRLETALNRAEKLLERVS